MAKYKVAIGPSSFAEMDDRPLQMLADADITVVPNPVRRRLTEDEIIDLLQDVDGLLAGLEPLHRHVLKQAPRLRVIARVGIGMSNVDINAAKELGIVVSNTPDGPTAAVAEMTIAAMLTLSRQLLASNEALHAGTWKKMIGLGLAGTNVFLIGYGRIGRRVAELLRAFGAHISIYDPMLFDSQTALKEKVVTMETGLREAQIVSLHASGEQIIIGAKELQQMQPGALLLNAARGQLIDEDALLRALATGHLGGAWCDVFRSEPYTGPLQDYKNVLLTPHMSTYTRQCRLEMEMAAVQNLIRDLGVSLCPSKKKLN